jgi:hypothetical protein
LRFIDLAIGGLIAVSSLAVLIAWNPQAPDAAARQNIDDAHLRDYIATVVNRVGIVTLIRDSASDLCSLVRSASNSTLTLSAEEGGVSCGGPPPVGVASAELNISVGSRVVNLESWYDAGR